MVASSEKPDLKKVCVVKKKYIKKILNKSKMNIHPMNKFNTLGIRGIKSYSIIDDNDSSTYSESWSDNDSIDGVFDKEYSYSNAHLVPNYFPWFEENSKYSSITTNTNKTEAFWYILFFLICLVTIFFRG